MNRPHQPQIPGAGVAPIWDPDEKTFQRYVIDAAHQLGWIVAHFRTVQVIRGGSRVWQTPVQADGAGFPDLELVGRGRILHRELKRRKGKPTPEQIRWGERINANGGDWKIWTPADWPHQIILELGGKVGG